MGRTELVRMLHLYNFRRFIEKSVRNTVLDGAVAQLPIFVQYFNQPFEHLTF